jgi:cell division protein FtsI (penicillin-binding protein 3)
MPRRPIVDRQGTIVAIDQLVYDVYAHPLYFEASQDAIATQLSRILTNRTQPELANLLQTRDSGIRLAEAVSRGVAQQIRELGLQGIDLEAKQQRFYPYNDLLAQVTGFVFFDERREGQSGIELVYQEQLRRTPGKFDLQRMQDGTLMPDINSKGFQPQDDLRLQLTIDSRLQQVAQMSLQQQMETFDATQGAVIVMDTWDGALLALATAPSYDPNHYYESEVERFRNWAVTDLYEPGSTFKSVNVAIALESGAVRANDQIYDEGQIQIDTWPISNHDFNYVGGRGALSITEVLQYSSNVGMVHIMEQMPPGDYYDALTNLGLGQPWSTDLPSPATGYLKSRSTFELSRVDAATAAFGQGISLTPLQMAQILAPIGNGGELVTPHVVSGLVDSENQLHWQPERSPSKAVFSETTAQTVLEMMEAVVTDGTGKNAAIDGYRVAGKTGTAQKAKDGSYLENAKITSFVSLFPVEAPRYLIFVVVDEPKGAGAAGSTVAAPVAKQVMESIIGLYGIPPSQPEALNAVPDAGPAPANTNSTEPEDLQPEDSGASLDAPSDRAWDDQLPASE